MIWKRFGRGKAEEPLDESLKALEERAQGASPAYQGQHFNRAGDLCLEAGDVGKALRYWGEAIDAYLGGARPEAAAAVCRKAIRHAPNVVRARRTLALLAIGQGHMEEALEQLEEYVRSAVAANQTELAVKQLRLMGEATWSGRFRHRVALLLTELGDVEAARHVARPLPEVEKGPEEGPIPAEAHDRWATILRVALMPPAEVRRAL